MAFKDNGAIVMEAREQALGALANSAGIFVGTKIAITEDFRMLKATLAACVRTLTVPEGAGLLLYLVDGDLSLAEATAKVTQTGPLSRGARIETEIAERFVKLVGVMRVGSEVEDAAMFLDVLTNSPRITAKPRWTFHETQSWQWLVFNIGTTLTTGSSIEIVGEHFGLWLDA